MVLLYKMKLVRCLVLLGAMLAVSESCLAHAPEPRENDFFKIENAGFQADTSKSRPTLKYAFMFLLKKPIKILRVRVEDVSGNPPVLLVDDTTPKISGSRWRAMTPARPMTPDNFPWMFDASSTRKSFRVTVSTLGQGDIVLVQPTKFYASVKKVIIQISSQSKKKNK
jgi:hypothetical protein